MQGLQGRTMKARLRDVRFFQENNGREDGAQHHALTRQEHVVGLEQIKSLVFRVAQSLSLS